jgi:hypothetical protein
MSKKKGPEYIPPGINKKKIQTEAQSRINILNIAAGIGLKFDAETIFRRYDALLEKHSDPTERKQIATMGAAEIYKLLGFQDGLECAGNVVIPASDKYIEVQKAEEKEKLDKQAKEQYNKIIIPEIKIS